MPKTIFITSFHPIISRNILSSGVLELLAEDFKIIIFAPDFKKKYFEKEFASGKVLIEGIDTKLTWGDMLFRRLALVLANTKDLYIKRRSQFFQDKRLIGYLSHAALSKIFGGSGFFLNLSRFCDYYFFRTDFYGELLKKYDPALVFSTDLQNELDVRLIKEAARKSIKTVGMVRSWDNLTSKGILRVLPEKLIAHNDIVKKEAEKYSLVAAQKVAVVGVPHYDNYLKMKFGSKEEFFSRFGFDAGKKLILFSPVGDRYIRNNALDKLVLETLFAIGANILVRLPPTDTVNFGGFRGGRANVFFQNTGTGAWKGGTKLNEVSKEDDAVLAESLHFCDLVVTGQSTITIDAAVFNKPVVVIYFDSEPRVYWDSIRRYYDYEYYRPILKSGGIRLAHDPEGLGLLAEKYLKDPNLDMEGRRIIAREQAGLGDKLSVERLAEELRAFL